MRKINLFSFLILLVFSFTACKNEVKESESSPVKETGFNELNWVNAMDKVEQEIAISDAIANSLYYTKVTGESEKITAFLSQKNEILKVEESFSGRENENAGKIIYYLSKTIPMVTIELFEDLSNPKEVKFVERVSYYDEIGHAVYTKEKRVDYEEELEGVDYKSVDLVNLNTDRIFKVLNQEGEYQTTFQGFVETQSLNYLIVGEPKEGGFTSAMRIEFEDPFIKDIYKNPKKFLNKKMRVTFQVSKMQGNFEYQIYTGGSWE